MPEMSINLLKEKIIKTDTVISLLVDKNEKITQLREKLRMLYHKYVNKVKQCEDLELKIDMCKVEHNPLIMNINVLTNKYETLKKEHQLLTNTLEIKYQTKCMELESQVKKYNDLVNQKGCEKINEDVINLKCAHCKKNAKVSKQLENMNNTYEYYEDKIKELQKNINDTESNYQKQLKDLKENHCDEIKKLGNIIATCKLSESKLSAMIFETKCNKPSSILTNLYPCNINTNFHYEKMAEVAKLEHMEDSPDEEFDDFLANFCEEIPLLLSPLSECRNQENGNETIMKLNSGTDRQIKSDNVSVFSLDDDNIENCVFTAETNLNRSNFENQNNSNTEVSRAKGPEEKNIPKTSECLRDDITETTEVEEDCGQNNFRFVMPEDEIRNIFSDTSDLVDINFGSLATIHLQAEDILNLNQSHNYIEDNLIIDCFDDNLSFVRDYYRQNNDYNLVNTLCEADNRVTHDTNLQEIADKEAKKDSYIPKCTLANELIGFFKESDIVDKVSNRIIKSYAKSSVRSLINSSTGKTLSSSNVMQFPNGNNIECNLNVLKCVNENARVTSKEVTDVTVHDCQPVSTASADVVENYSLLTTTAVPTIKEFNRTSSTNISANNITGSANVDVSEINNMNSQSVQDASHNSLSADLCRNTLLECKANNNINNKCCDNLIITENNEKSSKVLNAENETCCHSTPTQLNNIKKSVNKLQKQCVKQISNRTKQTKYYKMRTELFYALVQYFSRSSAKRTITFQRRRNKSPNFKRHRRLQMLRWKQLRETHLPATDTDSDHSRKNKYIKRKNRRRSYSEKENLGKPTEMTSAAKEEQLTELSDDELTFRQIIKEEMECQKLLCNYKELEQFYYMCNDSSNTSKVPLENEKITPDNKFIQESRLQSVIDTIESCSADSGYVKSDSDEINTVDSSKRKRIHSTGDIDKCNVRKKFILSRYLGNDICDFKQSIPENVLKKNEVADTNINTFNQTIPAVTTQYQTESDSSVRIGESKEIGNLVMHNIGLKQERNLHHENIDSSHVLDSDCENISSQDDSKCITNSQLPKTRVVSCTNKHYEIQNKRVEANLALQKIRSKLKLQNTSTMYKVEKELSYNVSITNKKKNGSIKYPMLKSNTKQIKKRSKLRKCQTLINDSEPTLQMEISSDTVDPLRARLWEECLSNITQITKEVQTACTYKRSNTLKNREKVQIQMSQPLDANKLNSIETFSSLEKKQALSENVLVFSEKLPVINECNSSNKKLPTKVLREEKARTLLKYILTFPDKLSIVEEVVTAFSTQSKAYIVRMIILEVSCDINKADTKYTPPAPLLTETQRILLGILVRLDRTSSPGVLDHFLLEAEKYILKSNKLQCIENVSRLYLAICKLQRKIHRMRRMVCDAFYFMGDLSIPFLFTVLSTWIEVIPVHTEQNDEVTVKVIIEIIQQKNCSLPGYNLIPLKSLLKAYYGYNMNESCLDHIIVEILGRYKDTQEKHLEYAILLLCKNLEKDCIIRKIKQHFHSFLESTKDTVLKAKIQWIIDRITEDHK